MPDLAGAGRVLKRFRVAREGQTVDGRALTRLEIQQIADTYNPSTTYGARVNVEHISGWSPEPPFNAYGDIVLADAAEENGKLCLYNTISALPNLLALNKAGQKIYPSIEFYRDFAGTGKAYQVGLGLTDTPASLGTEAIKFSSANPNLSRTLPDTEICMFGTTPAVPTATAPLAVPATPTIEDKTLFSQLKELLTPKAPTPPAAPEDFNATVTQGLVTALQGIANLGGAVTELKNQLATMGTPATQPAAPAVPATQPTATTVSAGQNAMSTTPAPAEQQPVDPIVALTQQMQQFSQQLQTLAATPANPAPTHTGGAGDVTPY